MPAVAGGASGGGGAGTRNVVVGVIAVVIVIFVGFLTQVDMRPKQVSEVGHCGIGCLEELSGERKEEGYCVSFCNGFQIPTGIACNRDHE